MSVTYQQFAARVIDLLKEADTASDVDRIIAVSKLRACANDYLCDLKPTGQSDFVHMQSQAVGSAKKQKVATGKLF